jgi:lipopolysaccharide biosynthesis glycosyltransferase
MAITPLAFENSNQGDGTNAFTYARFLVPELCDFSGFAIFADGADMMANADLAELWALRSPEYAVQVVKHDYKTKHPRKYCGTEMESANSDYPRKNWSSLIIWNCEHRAHWDNRAKLRSRDGAFLHRFGWLKDQDIGELPIEWNWLADEYGANTKAKLLHRRIGYPAPVRIAIHHTLK